MQKPRRTSVFSEFRDEFQSNDNTGKRPSRQRSTVVPSPQQGISGKIFKTRLSRLRPPSLDRERSLLPQPQSTAKLSLPAARFATPQFTPLRNTPICLTKSSTQRALFSVERTAASGGALYNDKKWIQERTHYITEYLKEMAQPGAITSVGPEFFNRGHGLRQMSIKQFVGIVNFFLYFVWRKRFVVGTNHVDDIISILQRLDYPHSVNKSWLITPNTQSSFGHVIVLLDFLKDFAPPSMTELNKAVHCSESSFRFEFELLNDDNPASILQNNFYYTSNQSVFSMPLDVAFRGQLLFNAAEAFEYWDKALDTEYKMLLKKTSDMIIKKKTNLDNYAALDNAISEMEVKLDNLRSLLPMLPQKDEEQAINLNDQLEHLKLNVENSLSNLKKLQSERDALQQQIEHNEHELKMITALVSQTQESVKQQKYNSEDRDGLLEQYSQLCFNLQMHKRTQCDLQDRNLNQQVMLSRAKNEQNEQLEKLNKYMSDLKFSEIPSIQAIADGFSLCMQPLPQDIEKLSYGLKAERNEIDENINIQYKRRLDLVKQIHETMPKIKNLQSKWNILESQLSTEEQILDEGKAKAKRRRNIYENLMEQLKTQVTTLFLKLKQQQDTNNRKSRELSEKGQSNEQTMLNIEQKHAELLAIKEKNLNDYETALNELDKELKGAKINQ